jgi:hypothetical protein
VLTAVWILGCDGFGGNEDLSVGGGEGSEVRHSARRQGSSSELVSLLDARAVCLRSFNSSNSSSSSSSSSRNVAYSGGKSATRCIFFRMLWRLHSGSPCNPASLLCAHSPSHTGEVAHVGSNVVSRLCSDAMPQHVTCCATLDSVATPPAARKRALHVQNTQ